eukprot:jgi/Botrbrau1/16144/Bobra.0281s0001.1
MGSVRRLTPMRGWEGATGTATAIGAHVAAHVLSLRFAGASAPGLIEIVQLVAQPPCVKSSQGICRPSSAELASLLASLPDRNPEPGPESSLSAHNYVPALVQTLLTCLVPRASGTGAAPSSTPSPAGPPDVAESSAPCGSVIAPCGARAPEPPDWGTASAGTPWDTEPQAELGCTAGQRRYSARRNA